MEIKLNYLPDKEPINKQDIDWLKYIWECSNNFDVVIFHNEIPEYLVNTIVYKHLFERFIYYQKVEHLFDFEYREGNNSYYIVLKKGFVSKLNALIEKVNGDNCIAENNIQYICEKGTVVVNKQINSGTFNGPVCNQMGDENFSTQSPETVKKCELRFDFKRFIYVILKKIPFIKDFIKLEDN
jgi:hypothetical protein